MTAKIAIVLSGCGVYDGSEIHEASAACVAISRAGLQPVFYSVDQPQHHQINHITGENDENSRRNVLVESARIARGSVQKISELTVEAVDAVVFPGGFGAAKNLSSFATNPEPTVDPEVARVLREFVSAGKPLGLCCIAPILAALVLSKEDGIPIKVTLGQRSGEGWPYAATIDKAIEFGAEHEEKTVEEVCIDEERKIVTTPAFMFDAEFHQVHDGVSSMIQAVIDLI